MRKVTKDNTVFGALAHRTRRFIEAAAPFVLLAASWQVGSLFFPKYLFPSLVDVLWHTLGIFANWSEFAEVLGPLLAFLAASSALS